MNRGGFICILQRLRGKVVSDSVLMYTEDNVMNEHRQFVIHLSVDYRRPTYKKCRKKTML